MANRKYTAVYEKRGRWYVGYVQEVQGVNTQGRTLGEARKNLHEALQLVLKAQRQLSAFFFERVRNTAFL